MINSSLAKPTPAFGICANLKAKSGEATFNIIGVFVVGRLSSFVFFNLKGTIPSYTFPTSPSAQLTVNSSPLKRTSVPFSVPTIAGTPISRATIAA